MNLSPDQVIYWQYGFVKLNATIVYTWLIMAGLCGAAKLITTAYQNAAKPSRWHTALEIIVSTIESQIRQIGLQQPRHYLVFLGSLFVFIAISNLLAIVPGFTPPTGSLSTTAALALWVFIAVPFYGISRYGIKVYLSSYAQPTAIMLPFNVIGELSRTLALCVRLFGNIMSGTMIIAILLVIAPFIFPIFITLLGLLTGFVQAYIFFVLATVYISAATSIKTNPITTKGESNG